MSDTVYDQRWVRSAPRGFRSASNKVSLCDVCGDEPRCDIRKGMNYAKSYKGAVSRVEECAVYIPVVKFADRTGLDSPIFNSFRRGQGWHRRLSVGSRVRFYANDLENFVGDGRVTETHFGPLSRLLEDHASLNHCLVEGLYADAFQRLHQILVKLYGKTYASLSAPYSVIYFEPV